MHNIKWLASYKSKYILTHVELLTEITTLHGLSLDEIPRNLTYTMIRCWSNAFWKVVPGDMIHIFASFNEYHTLVWNKVLLRGGIYSHFVFSCCWCSFAIQMTSNSSCHVYNSLWIKGPVDEHILICQVKLPRRCLFLIYTNY